MTYRRVRVEGRSDAHHHGNLAQSFMSGPCGSTDKILAPIDLEPSPTPMQPGTATKSVLQNFLTRGTILSHG